MISYRIATADFSDRESSYVRGELLTDKEYKDRVAFGFSSASKLQEFKDIFKTRKAVHRKQIEFQKRRVLKEKKIFRFENIGNGYLLHTGIYPKTNEYLINVWFVSVGVYEIVDGDNVEYVDAKGCIELVTSLLCKVTKSDFETNLKIKHVDNRYVLELL